MIKKKRTKLFWVRGFVFCLAVGGLLFCVIVQIFNLPLFNFLFRNEKQNQIDIYFVCLNTENMESPPTDIAKTYKARGGAGLVFNIAEKDYVILSCYKSQNQAKLVVNNLKASEPNLEVHRISILQPGVKNLTEEDKNQFLVIFDFLKEMLEKLDEIIFDLSQNKLTDVKANLQINNLLLKTRFYEQKLLEKNELEKTSYVLSNVSNVLNYVCGETALTENYLSYQAEIRRAFVRIVLVLYENFKN